MAEGSKDDDPFDWGVERVVKELCTTDRTWTPTPRAKLPDPDELAEKIRDGEYDGDLLLSSTEKDLWDYLDITRPKYKVALRCAISQFKSRSRQYKKWRKHLVRTDDGSESDDTRRPYHRQPQTPHQAFTPVSEISGSAIAQPIGPDQDGSKAMQLDEDVAEAPSKKRRLATSELLTTERAALPQGQMFNIASIPTEADNMSFLPTETENIPPAEGARGFMPPPDQASLMQPNMVVVPTEAPAEPSEDFEENCKSRPGAYWGNGKLPKPDIINRLTTVEADPKMSFGWGEPRTFGKARKQYVCRVVQKHLLYPEQRTAPKEDPVLPAYGESSDDDNSEWGEVAREMQKEEDEVRLEKEEILGLEPEEVDAILEQMIEECAAAWHETSKEKHKAYAIWNEVRKHGTRRAEMQVLSRELQKAEQGFEKILKGLRDNQYSSEAELRGMSPVLEPCVQPVEHIKWLIRTISSPNAPEKVARPQAQVQAKPKQRPAQDSIDIWSEDELEDQVRDFIVDDDPLPEPDALSDDDDGHPPTETGIYQPASNIPVDPTQSFISSTDGDVEMHDLTNIDQAPPQGLDLTEMVISPTRKSVSSQALPAVRASPDPEEPPLSDVKAIANEGSLHWESKGDAKRLIITLLWNQPRPMRESLFSAMQFVSLDEGWVEYIEYGCKNWDKTFDDKKSREIVLHHTALLLIRLFNVFVQGCCTPPSAIIQKDYNRSLEWAKNNKEHFGPFWGFLNLVAEYFETSRNAVVKNASFDDVQSPLTPGTKRKHHNEEGDASQQFRARDRRRQQAQQARRLQLREQVEGSKILLEQSRLIINESKLEGQNLIYVHPQIAPLIKDHQIDGVRFMWDQLLSESNQGCLLAHTMGLGKTMQVITLLTAIQDAAKSSDPRISCQIPDHLKESRTLILCPPTLLNNWMEELLKWAPEGLLGKLFTFNSNVPKQEQIETIRDWAQEGGVLIIGYEMLTQLAKREDVLPLLWNKPSIVVGDEAHHLKNKKSKKSIVASGFKTHSRLALTGSPLANNVGEYYSMIHWVAPDFLGDWEGFNSEYATPIANGLYQDSSMADRRKSMIRLAALRKIVAPKVHRRTVGTVKDDLPPKKEFIIHLDISSIQKEIYLSYLKGIKGTTLNVMSNTTSLWSLIKSLRVLLAHPRLLEAKLQQVQQTRDQTNTLETMGNSRGVKELPPEVVAGTLATLTLQQGYQELKASFKMLALFKILDEAAKLGENTLLFSQSLATLDFIENVCNLQKRPYMRLDGNTRPNIRQSQVKEFNQGRGQVYLISTTAGGVGLNIHGASRVVIFDFDFNPANEQQAIGRSYRIGQTRPVFVYWLICDGTFEKTMHNQQVFKNQMASRVVDKKDLLPKARQMKEYFTEPQQVDHQDFSAYRGQDSILDILLETSEVNEGISSICTTETFEEEDTQQLPDEDQREAEEMARKTAAQKNNSMEEQMHYYQPLQRHFGEVRLSSSHSVPSSSRFVTPQGSASSAAVSTAAAAVAQVASSVPSAATTSVKAASLVTSGSRSHPGMSDTKSTTFSQPLSFFPGALPAESSNALNPPFANLSTQALPTELFHHATSQQIPTTGGYPLTNLAARVVPSTSTAATYGSVNPHPHPDPLPTATFGTHHASLPAMRRPATPIVVPDVRRRANNEQLPIQLPSNPEHRLRTHARSSPGSTPRPMSIDAISQGVQPDMQSTTDRAAGLGYSIAADSQDSPLPQGMSPTSWGMAQIGHAQTTATSGNASLREDNAPMTMDTTSKSDTLATSGDEVADFRSVLERQAPSDLRHLVPTTVTRIRNQFTEGRLLRILAWKALTSSVRGRPDRAAVILRELAPLERVAEVAKKGDTALAALLDGAHLPQGGRKKDPDHTQRMLERSISNRDQHNDGSTQKAQDKAAMREVFKNRQSKSQKIPKPQEPQKPKKIKREDAERRRHTMPAVGSGGGSGGGSGSTSADPMLID